MATARTYALNGQINPLGLYASDDLGLTWAIVDATGVTASALNDIKAAPYDSNQILIATSTSIIRSLDGGATFNVTGNTGVKRLFYKDVNSIIGVGGSGNNPQIITISDNGGGIFTSTGVTAADLADNNAVNPVIDTVFFTNNASGFISVSWAYPAGGKLNRIWRTTDGGFTWTNSVDLLLTDQFTGYVTSIHADLNADKVTILTRDQGIWQIDYALLGVLAQTYTTINGGDGGLLHQVGVDPSKVFLIAGDGSLYYSADSGTTFTQRTASVGSTVTGGGMVAYDELTLVVYASSNIYRSEDGGITFTDVFTVPDKPRGIDASVITECGLCPEGFTLIESFGGRNKRCERTTNGGPLCNPPYFYDTVTNSCAIPSTAIPFNIVLNIDTSGSIGSPDPQERTNLVLFLKLFVDEMTPRLITKNTQIAIVLWNDLSCLQLDFSSDPTALKTALDAIDAPGAINRACAAAGYQYSGGTNHAVGFATSVRTLYSQATLRPSAENVVITCTDGAGIGTCDLTDLGYRTVVNDNACELIRLADEVRANLAGKPSKMMLLAVGTDSERRSIEQSFINNAVCTNNSKYYPSLNDDGQPYYYDAGDFGTVADFAKQLIIGLEAQISPAFQCPDDCQDVPGTDNLGYCACTETLEFQPCLYKLVNCRDDQDTIITDADLLLYLEANNIITIEGSTTCWQIESTDPGTSNPTTVIVDTVYTSCATCTVSYAFVNCRNKDLIFYSIEDFSNEVGKVVNLIGYPDECWSVILNTNPTYTPEDITIDGTPYNDCPTCISPKYYLSNCSNDSAYLVTKSDLEQYVGQIVSVRGYPGVCFKVESVYCNCVKVILNTGGRDKEYVAYKSLNQINGRNQYIITTGQFADYLLAWNSGELRWEFYDINTNELLSYSPIDSECPYSGYWVNEGSLQVISVQTCVSAISNVEVEKAYTECRCCIYKNCY